MKKGLVLLLVSIASFGQKKEVIYKKLAATTCECATKKSNGKLTEMDLGICIFEALATLDPKEQKTINFNPEKKTENLETIAESVGLEMALKCPSVFAQFKDFGQDNDNPIASVSSETSFSETGVITEIVGTDFKIVKMKSDADVPKEFIWLTSFEGDTLLMKNKIVKGDQVQIQYIEKEFFDAKSATYKKYNQIIGIKLM